MQNETDTRRPRDFALMLSGMVLLTLISCLLSSVNPPLALFLLTLCGIANAYLSYKLAASAGKKGLGIFLGIIAFLLPGIGTVLIVLLYWLGVLFRFLLGK